ncbi:DNA mismatch repair endonuclease MutL [Thorsellia anophelis]|uniref:DNA mismatch repair protein MutL n=1 Tax=Thorsellia anophelis DSM 18579 TaxID=1123402 RepID=A0A1I0BDH2_9GAMM|nr:DNA mismatch repair endonuclease MutL [Thorsellia anophelis]SET04239.1 DNA mismatch repair protein MutL [Thorsellia anophelis DSM 18579]
MAIKILSPQLANQIAAGEVVERPSSVVKELVENALDAEATQVEIQIEQGGAGLILIRDNGSGISKADLPFALARHATSKISDMEDLISILSFGFRGEALASISSVSRLTLTSHTAEQAEAWQVHAEGRDMNAVVKPAAHPIGTTVEVRNLFYNTPARRKFLRTEKTEFNHIDEVIKRIALVRHDVTFTLTHNGKRIRYYRAVPAQSELAQKQARVAQICGNRFIDSANHILWNHFDLAIEGWVMPLSTSELESSQIVQGIQYCYVNGRIVRDKVIMHAIKQAFQTYYPDSFLSDDKLAYVIYLSVSPEQVDVNVHPAKHEVRFHQNRTVHDFIYQAVMQSLEAHCAQIDLETGEVLTQSVISTINDNNRSSAGTNQFAGKQTTISKGMRNETSHPKDSSLARANISELDGNDRQADAILPGQLKPDLGLTSQQEIVNHDLQEQSLLKKTNVTSKQECEDSIKGTDITSSQSSSSSVESYLLDEETSLVASEPEIKNHYQQIFPTRDKPFVFNPDKLDTHEVKHQKTFQKESQDRPMSLAEKALYQQLITPAHSSQNPVLHASKGQASNVEAQIQTFGKALYVLNKTYLLVVKTDEYNLEQLGLVSLYHASVELRTIQFKHVIRHNSAQSLLVPMTLRLKESEWSQVLRYQDVMTQMQIIHSLNDKQKTLDIQTVPAPIRHGDIAKYLTKLFSFWINNTSELLNPLDESILFLAKLLVEELKGSDDQVWTLAEAINLVSELERMLPTRISDIGEPIFKRIELQ